MALAPLWAADQLRFGRLASPRQGGGSPLAASTFPDTELSIGIYAYMGADPTADPGTWGAAVDLSARLLDEPIQSTRGRSSGQRTLSSGSCTFALKNDDGALTPGLATSDYFGTWDLGVPMYITVDGVGLNPPYRRFCGFVVGIDPVMLPGVGGITWSQVKVTLGGVVGLRSQGIVEESCYRRWLSAQTLTAWWSLEDGPLGTGLADTADTQPIGAWTPTLTARRTFGGGDLAPWLLPGVGFEGSASTELVGYIPDAPYTDLAVDVLMLGSDTSSPSTAGLTIASFGTTTGLWTLGSLYNSGSPTLYITDSSFVNLDTGTDAQALAAWDGEMHVWRLRVTESGANVLVKAYLDGVEIMSGTKNTADLTDVDRVQHGANQVGTRVFGQVVVTTGSNITDPADVAEAAFGFAGELAHVRIARVCREEGISLWTRAKDGQPCGVQQVADFLAIIRDAETVDHGVLIEAKETWGLKYLGGQERYNRPAAMTIDLSTYRLADGSTSSADVLTPTRSNQRVRNEWRISRPDGGTVTVKDTDHQSRRGRYNDSADVNVEDDDALPNEGGWRVHENTDDHLRYRGMPIDPGSNNGGDAAALLAAWLELDLGDRIDRTNPPLPHPPDTVTSILEGYTETIKRKAWTVSPVIEPFNPWVVGVYAGLTEHPGVDEPKRYSPNQSLVGTSFVAGSDTSLAVVAQDSDSLWSTTADFPFDIRVAPVGVTAGGVRLRVTAIGSPSGMNQTMTVEATVVNGMNRTIPVGWEVSLWQPAVYAL